jgi:hypothetical protein
MSRAPKTAGQYAEKGQPKGHKYDRQVKRFVSPFFMSAAWINPVCSVSVVKKERELLKMHNQVLKDQEKIHETISKLDEYKRDALKTCWEQVNGLALASFFFSVVTASLLGDFFLFLATLATFLPSSCRAIFASCSLLKARTLRRVSKSKFA